MPLNASVVMKFTSYTTMDVGIDMVFLCPDPGPSMPSEYTIRITDDELAAINTQPQFTTLVTDKLKRKYRNQGIALKLDPMIGQSLTI